MVYPYVPEPTKTKFFVPKTLVSDFDEFLANDIPGSVMPFTVLHNWYDQFEEGYEEESVRFEIYPDSSKSRYSNTDNNQNVRASKNSDIRKGDIIIDPDGTKYLLDWDPPSESNNRASRALRCNMALTVKRYRREITDQDGYLLTPEGYDMIVEELPCNAYRYDGRPEYSAVAGQPGIVPNALTILSIQYNDRTSQLKEEDEFVWAGDIYIIVDINYVGVNFDQSNGVITLQAKKKAGGML